MGGMSDAVQLEAVVKRFGDHVAVDCLSFSVPTGLIYGFLGPNGAGKTTTLRMLIGIFYPDAGRITVLGQANPAAIKARIGYLPEDRGLYDKMKLGELVSYYGELKGMPAGKARMRAKQLLEQFGLGEWWDAKCQALSKGMAQKAQILATILHEPELVTRGRLTSGAGGHRRGRRACAALRPEGVESARDLYSGRRWW